MRYHVLGGGFSALALFALSGAAACTPEEGHPPVARIEASPGVIPENDGFQTPVTLDGSGSADPLDDPEGQRPLEFVWDIRSDEFRFDTGSRTSASPVVSFRGDRPAIIDLTVTDEDGQSSTVTYTLTLTVQ
jgi:hypothetical protein